MPDFETLTVRVKGEASGFDRAMSRVAKSAASTGSKLRTFGDDTDNSFAKAGDSAEELVQNLTGLKRAGAATAAAVPALIAGVGALVPAATSAAVGIGQLSTALAAGAAGFAIFGGAAGAAAAGGLKAYTAAVSSTVTASREAYLATNEKVEKQLEEQKQTILNTKASLKFNEAVNRLTLGYTRLQAEVGKRVFPTFTRWIALLEKKGPALQKPFLGMISDVTRVADGFVKAQMQGQKFANVMKIMGFVRRSTEAAAWGIRDMAEAGLAIFPMLIRPSERLMHGITTLTARFNNFANSAEGARKIGAVLGYMEDQMYKVLGVGKNLILLFVNIGKALNFAGRGSQLLSGLNQGMAALVRNTQAGSQGFKTLQLIGIQSQPILSAMGSVLSTIARETGLLIKNLMGAKDASTGLNPLIPILNAIKQSIRPLRILVQETFLEMAPTIAKIIPNLVKFFSVFAGSTGSLTTFMNMVNRMLTVFNALPGPVKSSIAEFMVFSAITSSLTGSSIPGLIGALFSTMMQFKILRATQAMSNGTMAASGNIALLTSVKMKVAAAATRAWTIATKAAAVAGRVLRFVILTMLGPWGLVIAAIVAGAYLIYKHWDKIKLAAQALWKGVVAAWRAIKTAVVAAAKFVAQAVVNYFRLQLSTWKAIGSALLKAVRFVWNAIKNATVGAAKAAWKGAVAAFTALKTGVGGAINATRKWVVNTVQSMVKGALNLWDNMRKGAVSRFDAIRKGVTSRIDTTRKNVVQFVDNMRQGAMDRWETMRKGAVNIFETIKSSVTSRIDDMRRNVLNLVDRLRAGVGNLWDKMMSGARGFGEGFFNTVKNWFGKAVNAIRGWLGSAALGLANLLDKLGVGPVEELRDVGGNLQQPIEFARGGMYNADKGGVAGPGRMGLVGEAGDREAIVNLDRRTPESQKALKAANKSPNARNHRGGEKSRKHGHVSGRGEGLGPTHHNISSRIRDRVNKIASATGTSWNTYVGHGQPGGSTEAYTADFWGKGGRGSPLSASQGNKAAEMAISQYNGDPATLYVIAQGRYWRGGSWKSWGQDPHYDHTHVSWDSPGGATASGGSGPNVMALWSSFTDKLGGFPTDGIAGTVMSGMGGAVLGWIKDYVWKQAASFLGGGSAEKVSGDHMQWHEAGLKYSGAFPVSPTNLSKLHNLAMKESGDNPNAKNPSGASGLMQMMPSTFDAHKVNSGDSIMNPIHNTAASARYQKAQYGGLTTQSPYHRGGVIPGAMGQEVMALAQAGERILPASMTDAFDRLAHSITAWSTRGGATGMPGGIDGGKAHEDILKEIDRKLDRQLKKMATKEELADVSVRANASFAKSDGFEEILDHLGAKRIRRIRELTGA